MATAYVIFGDGTSIRADVADTEDARARGLMHPPSPSAPARLAVLAEDAGMLFVFDRPGRYAFWMKNVPMPLDIIWLDAERRIVWIAENAPPCAAEPCPMYAPGREASFVVEVAGGFVSRHRIAIGDIVLIDREG